MKNRVIKQIIYGGLYLSFWASIFAAVYFAYLKPEPSCFDRRQNQNETGVDCGGVCRPCELRTIQPVKIGWVRHFLIGGTNQTIVAAELTNPNPSYAAEILPYKMDIFGPFGAKIKNLEGRSFIYAGEVKYFVENIPFDPRDVSRVELAFGDPKWVKPELFSKPAVNVRSVETKLDSGARLITVSAVIVNSQSLTLPESRVAAVLFDQAGNPLTASQTLITGLPGFKEEAVILTFPAGEWIRQLAPDRTKIFVETKL